MKVTEIVKLKVFFQRKNCNYAWLWVLTILIPVTNLQYIQVLNYYVVNVGLMCWLYINNKKVSKNPLYLRTSFALCHYLWYVWFSFSYLSRYLKISLLIKWPIGYFECSCQLVSNLFFKHKFIYFNWTPITLQYWNGFAIHWHESSWVYSPSWTPLPPPSPSHPSRSSQCTIPEHPVSCTEPQKWFLIWFQSC